MRRTLFFILALLPVACNTSDNKQTNETQASTVKRASIGLSTIQINLADYTKVIYISLKADSVKGTGNKNQPFQLIKEGIEEADGKGKTAILVSSGVYEESGLDLKPETELFGGYSPDFNERDIQKYQTTINANKENRVLTLGDNTRIDGFFIQKGQIRGPGGAFFTSAKNVLITNNIFNSNKTLKPIPWQPEYWHETAHDGGAVYCTNGAEVTLENNLFIGNTTENGRGGAIAAENKCRLTIRNNLFYQNITGSVDTMRSSDGGAVALFRWTKARVENNIFLSNTALNHNDAGGLWLALWTSATVDNNLFVDNYGDDDAGAIFVGGQEHRYNAPLDPIPPKNKFFISITGNTIIGNRNRSMNSGAMRFTMEGRGEFMGNTTAFNNGIYFQRSEVLISGNTILDNFLLVETKKGLNPCTVKDNIIWSDYTQEVKATVENNNMLYPPPNKNNYNKNPNFINDGMSPVIGSLNYLPKQSITRILLLNDQFKENELKGRVVRTGNKWGVIKSNKDGVIEVWGNFSGEASIRLLPTYQSAK